ncbi:helix-turn-helix domain-containing protein [Devosia psychrophila]|uniref:Helix-turn-helix domain-containing protein n=1 Tax=Devosia psychrophila TaxID=728005 RepID=A0A0F5Q1V3_9HYPH|nr:helix-turn-helix domain-containing protein [Devosia psychrophila]KKC34606.1 hypothetical protein WH91_01790 [Devosia psychrophila]SFD00628.1 Helix-turn-helix domain-containing protein [Devosia psychrophila]
MTPEKAAYTLLDFLTRYGISKSSAYREINAGRLKAVKRGRATLITAEAATAWLNSLPAAGKAA